MKSHGKGLALSINEPNMGGTMKLANVSEGVPRREWEPLKSWPACAHPQQARLDEFHAVPSRFV